MTSPQHPLQARPAGDIVAWVRGRPLTVERLMGDAARLARLLPAQGPALNLCQDRYSFSVGLLAALARRHLSLMPPNALPQTLESLQIEGQAPYALVDDDAAVGVARGLSTLVVGSVIQGHDEPASDAPPLQEPQPQDPVVCLLTSGSTGQPTAHGKRWDDLKANIAAEAARLAHMLARDDLQGITLVGTVPPQHSYGLESTVLLSLLGGAAFESGRPYFPADIVDALASVPRPRALVTTPFHLKTLLDAGLDLPPTDLVLCATAPLSPQLALRAEQALGACLIEIYGCTEAGQVASRRTTEGAEWTALDGLRLWRQAHGGEETPESFWVEGGHVREPIRLADLLALESDTRFRLLGRANDLIHVGGKRSSMGHLNFQLNRVPGVVDGAMWMPPDEADGITRPVAFVVAEHRDASAVIRGLRGLLEPVFIPRQVVFVDELPRSDTGKLTSSALAQLARRHGLTPEVPASSPPEAGSHAVSHDEIGAGHHDKMCAGSGAGFGAEPGDDWQRIAADHPAFNGHFPAQPVLPGVVLLGQVQAEMLRPFGGCPPADTELSVEQVKFLRFVQPEDEIRVRLQKADRPDGPRSFTVDVRPRQDNRSDQAGEAGIAVAAKGVISLVAKTHGGS